MFLAVVINNGDDNTAYSVHNTPPQTFYHVVLSDQIYY